MEMIEYAGKQLYQLNFWKERKRYLTYRFRCWLHSRHMDGYLHFWSQSPSRQAIIKGTPALLEQVTRGFFYKNSTWQERINLVQTHIQILEAKLSPETLAKLYVTKEPLILWQDEYEGQPLLLELTFNAGQRKEGCLSLSLRYNNKWLYQIMFWIGGTIAAPAIYIGAIQGLLNGEDLIKGLTKAFFGYRTKNLIFYGLRAFARELGCTGIYGVTNQGYYAQNHLRWDRKLKTDFGQFWTECEGHPTQDPRFYLMPIAEHRKTMEELKPSKRAQHRRRFEKLDQIDLAVSKNMTMIVSG